MHLQPQSESTPIASIPIQSYQFSSGICSEWIPLAQLSADWIRVGD